MWSEEVGGGDGDRPRLSPSTANARGGGGGPRALAPRPGFSSAFAPGPLGG